MVSGSGSNTVRMSPTFVGYIGSTKDALLIIQAVLNNQLLAVPRRPHDRERLDLIQSGNVFVFIEEKSGIKRWTDGVAWSPSRILGRFLVYRELDRQALSNIKGEKPIAVRTNERPSIAKKKRKSFEDLISNSSGGSVLSQQHSGISSVLAGGIADTDSNSGESAASSNLDPGSIPNRSLVGSLIASYAFKEYGLIKKTLSLTITRLDSNQQQSNNIETVHLVSYYSAEDVLNGKLLRPVDSSNLKDLQLSNELWNAVKESSLGGKIPIEDEAYYFMDQSNPNAIALGFNPAIHLQPQYQQNNQYQQSHQPYSAQSLQQQQHQQQQQSSHFQVPGAHGQFSTQQPSQATGISQIPNQSNQGFHYASSYPLSVQQYPSSLHHQQLPFQPQQQLQPQQFASDQHSHPIHLPTHPHHPHHQGSASFSLPPPTSYNGPNSSNNSSGASNVQAPPGGAAGGDYFSDLNPSLQQQQQQQQQQQHSQQQQQIRYSPNQPFSNQQVFPNPSFTFQSHNPSIGSGSHQQQSTSSESSTGAPNQGINRTSSPHSPTKIKQEHSPIVSSYNNHSSGNNTSNLGNSTGSSNYNVGFNLSSTTPRHNDTTGLSTPNFPTSSSGNFITNNIGSNNGGNVPQITGLGPNGGNGLGVGAIPNSVGGLNQPGGGRWFMDENGQAASGSFVGGYQPYAPPY